MIPTPEVHLLSGDLFDGQQSFEQVLTFYDTPFMVLVGSGDRAASPGLGFDVRQGIPGSTWTLDQQLSGVSPATAWTAFQNATYSQAVVTDGVTANAITYWGGGAPGWLGVSERARVALHYWGEIRPPDNRSWFSEAASFPMCLALGGNGYARVDVDGVNVFDGQVTEAEFLSNGLTITEPFTIVSGSILDVYYVQRNADKGWGGFVAKTVPGIFSGDMSPEVRNSVLRDAPVLGCGLFDTGVAVPPMQIEFASDVTITREHGKAAEASFVLPLINPAVHDGNGWEWRRDLVDTTDPGALRFHRGNDAARSYDVRRQRLVTIDVTAGRGATAQTYRAFTGAIQDVQGVSSGTATVLLQDQAQRLLETFDKNFPDRIDYISRNHRRRKGATEPVYDIPAFDNWRLELAVENLAWRSGVDPSCTRQAMVVSSSGVGATPVTFGGESFRKFRARALNNKPIRLSRGVHYGNYAAAFTELKSPDDPYLFPPENTREVWARMRDLTDRYGYDLAFDESGALLLKSTNNPHAVYNCDMAGASGATAGAAAEAYAGTYLNFASGGTWSGTVFGARLDVSVGRGVSFGGWSYTVTRVSDSVVVASGSFATASGQTEFFYNYVAATDGVNSTVATLYTGDFDEYTVALTGTGHVRLDAIFAYHTDPETTKLPVALSTSRNAFSVRAQDTMAEMRNYVIVVGRRKATVTDSEKLEHNPNNPEQEFIVAAAVDKASITDPTALHFVGSVKETLIYSDTIADDDFAQYIARVFIYRYHNPKAGATIEHTLLPMVQLRDVVNARETRYATVDTTWPLWVQKITHRFGGPQGKKWATTLETTPYPEYPSFEPRNDIDIDATFEGRPAINVTVDYTSLSGDDWVNPTAKAVYVSKDTPYNAADGEEAGDLVETANITLTGGDTLDLTGYPWPPVPGTVFIQPTGVDVTNLTLKTQTNVIQNQALKPGARIVPAYAMANWQSFKRVRLTAKKANLAGLTGFTSLASVDLTTNGNDNVNGFYYQLVGDGRTRQVAIHRQPGGRPFDADNIFVSVDVEWYQGVNHSFPEWLAEHPYGRYFDVDYENRTVTLNWEEGGDAFVYLPPTSTTYKVRYRRMGPTDESGDFQDPYSDGSPFYDPYTSELGYLVRLKTDFLVTGYYRVSIRSAADPTTVVAWLTETANESDDPEAHWTFHNAGSNKTFFWDGSDTIGEHNIQQSEDYADFAHGAFEQDQRPRLGKGFYAWNRERDGGRLGPLALIDGTVEDGEPVWGAGVQGTFASWIVQIEATNDELEEVQRLTGKPAIRRVRSNDLKASFQSNVTGSTTEAYIHTHLPAPNRVELTVDDWVSAATFDELDYEGDNGPNSTTNWFPSDITAFLSDDYGFINNYKPVRVRFALVPRPGALWDAEATNESGVKLNRITHLKALINDQFVTYDGVSYPDSRTEAKTLVSRRLANDSHTKKDQDAGWRKGKDFKTGSNPDGVEWIFQPKHFEKDWFGTVEEPIEFGNYRQLEEVPKWDPAQDVGGARARMQLSFMAYLFYLSVYAQDRSGRFTWALRPDFVDTSKIVTNATATRWPDDPDRQHRRTILCRQWTDERVTPYQTWVAYQTAKWGLSGTTGAKLLKHLWSDHDPSSTTLAGAAWPTLGTDAFSTAHNTANQLQGMGFTGGVLARQLRDADFANNWTFESDPLWYPSITRDFFPYQMLPPMFDSSSGGASGKLHYYLLVDVSDFDSDANTGSDAAKGDAWSSGIWDMTESSGSKKRFWPGTKIQPKNQPLKDFDLNAAQANNLDYLRQDDTQHYEEFRGVFSRGPRPGEQPKRIVPILPYFVNPGRVNGIVTRAARNNPVYPSVLVSYENYFAVHYRGEYLWESSSLFPTDQYGVLKPALINHERCRFPESFAARAAARFDTGAWVGWKDDTDPGEFFGDTLVWNTGDSRSVFDSGYMPVAISSRVPSNRECYFHLSLVNERRGVPLNPTIPAGVSTAVDTVQWNPVGPINVTVGTYVTAVPTAYNASSEVITGGRFTYRASFSNRVVITDQEPSARGISILPVAAGTVTITATHTVTGLTGTITLVIS